MFDKVSSAELNALEYRFKSLLKVRKNLKTATKEFSEFIYKKYNLEESTQIIIDHSDFSLFRDCLKKLEGTVLYDPARNKMKAVMILAGCDEEDLQILGELV